MRSRRSRRPARSCSFAAASREPSSRSRVRECNLRRVAWVDSGRLPLIGGTRSASLDPDGESLDELHVRPGRGIAAIPGRPGPPDQGIGRHMDQEVRRRSRLTPPVSALEAIPPRVRPHLAELTRRRRSGDGLVSVLGHGPVRRAGGHAPPRQILQLVAGRAGHAQTLDPPRDVHRMGPDPGRSVAIARLIGSGVAVRATGMGGNPVQVCERREGLFARRRRDAPGRRRTHAHHDAEHDRGPTQPRTSLR